MPTIYMTVEWFDFLCGLTGIIVGWLFVKAVLDAYLN